MANDTTDLQAGRELDALVAEKVFGYEWLDEVRERKDDPYGFGPTRWQGWVKAGTKEPIFDMMWRHESGLHQPLYSTNIAAAWEVVEHLRQLDYFVALIVRPDKSIGPDTAYGCEVSRFFGPFCKVNGNTMPEAICRAALAAKGATT